MNPTANYIKQRLSLREPLQDSLDIVAQLCDELELQKEVDLAAELDKIRAKYPTCTDFERDFVSIAFSIATGVGKTRLMGAIISYLYLQKGIKNFFILAPNLTIYNKLIEDFGNASYHKYVFKGISEFVNKAPEIITGDNYNQISTSRLLDQYSIVINIFNISKFNSDNRGTTRGGISLAPRIKRLSEYLGTSYWNYLSSLDDLVILMDEAHRYHADASKKAINELKPVLGIELTATPYDEKGNDFKNIVYEYSLARALDDGKYVKNPTIATRKNFNPKNRTDEEIQKVKLEDAVSVHIETKNELEIYSRDNNVKLVKPFILVVCRDISHATEVYEYINSTDFYSGAYIDKVLQIDSSTRKDDEIENLFISLEEPDNEIEIVIHVEMLKEGWDVSNLYTIVPLKAANAKKLIEQTIGRGLRLPFEGKRTGISKLDMLTVLAHDKFDAVIKEAQDPNSILNKMSQIEIPEEELDTQTEVVVSPPVIESGFVQEQEEINQMDNSEKREEAQNNLDARKAIMEVLPETSSLSYVHSAKDLSKQKVGKKVMELLRKNLASKDAGLFTENVMNEVEKEYYSLVAEYQAKIIEIPRMDLVQGEAKAEFKDFDLDTSGFTFQLLNQEIMRMGLKDKKVDIIRSRYSGTLGNPVKIIVAELIDYPEIDYDESADLLYKLAEQAYKSAKDTQSKENEAAELVFQYKSVIAGRIYDQMKENFILHEPDYIEPKVLPFNRIENWNFNGLVKNGYKDYKDIVSPTNSIPKYIFRGFEKACHLEYKFDSKSEQDMAFVLENDKNVLKWLRPASNQFRIYWDNNTKRYEPDFVVETIDNIYMVEVKRSDQLKDETVLAKKVAAVKYCKNASDYTLKNGGKEWNYIIIPHNEIERTFSFEYLIGKNRI